MPNDYGARFGRRFISIISKLLLIILTFYLFSLNGCLSQCQGTCSAGDSESIRYNYSFDLYPSESTKGKFLDLMFNISIEPQDISASFLIPERFIVDGVQLSGLFADAEWRRDKSILIIEQHFSDRGKRGRILIPIESTTQEERYISLLNISFMAKGAIFRIDPNCCYKLICDQEYDCVTLGC